MINFPKIKKEIHSFLTKEDGKISKEKIIKAGILAVIASAAITLNSQKAEAGGHWAGHNAAICQVDDRHGGDGVVQVNGCNSAYIPANNAGGPDSPHNSAAHCNTLTITNNANKIIGTHNHGYSTHSHTYANHNAGTGC